MYPCLFLILALDAITLVNAGLYVVKPLLGSTCHAGKPCTVDWLDDGTNPLLTAIGVVDVGLYHGKQQLVQTIRPVNVATVHSLTFTPIPEAGPNSDSYYLSLVSTSLSQNASQPYAAFSSFFRLDGMTGSFDTPNSAATTSFPVPSSVATSGKPLPTDTVLSTITVGVISSTSSSSISSHSAHTTTSLRQSSAAAPTIDSSASIASVASVDVPINNPPAVSPTSLRFSTLVSPPFTISPAVESRLSSSSSSTPLPSATVANTTPPNGATTCNISSAANIFIATTILFLVMAF
ncbi:hypothetical protein AGABI1DRAFT_129593 [Agaricus bisporus var. burnettii JB137-S8]|uniref:Yeast cell wall synthesis Kre9/Knh1-like N-terminal domain-containing protein n=1 Tax=Agaricus bisporus var. burnettii (strain JB137-S8 / ATCC MYA-4627 / FGSC 10392) TaxID=597362 RepID=K5XTV3_AGABU|nr:uncharacterized protein AGABI1DRAFT_129593 [Agaricus bisporus var. burnettii JB137-S8]EKM78485.1 hypothetical protein AGABI1DRAFT_129593 [Agaricus bisporus var. burnettii JB137-S8]